MFKRTLGIVGFTGSLLIVFILHNRTDAGKADDKKKEKRKKESSRKRRDDDSDDDGEGAWEKVKGGVPQVRSQSQLVVALYSG